MGLDTVVDDIRDEAREEADRIVSDAEEDRDARIEEAEEEADRILEQAEEEAESETEALREQTLSGARLEAKTMQSRARKELLDDLRGAVEDRLAALDDGREDLTGALLDDAIAELDTDEGTVHVAAGDEDIVGDLLAGRDGFELGGTEDVLGGVIVDSADGDVRVTNTFDAVLDRVWSDDVREITSRLLGEE
jgi:V/A-type H+-transporting ATPase subunit E